MELVLVKEPKKVKHKYAPSVHFEDEPFRTSQDLSVLFLTESQVSRLSLKPTLLQLAKNCNMPTPLDNLDSKIKMTTVIDIPGAENISANTILKWISKNQSKISMFCNILESAKNQPLFLTNICTKTDRNESVYIRNFLDVIVNSIGHHKQIKVELNYKTQDPKKYQEEVKVYADTGFVIHSSSTKNKLIMVAGKGIKPVPLEVTLEKAFELRDIAIQREIQLETPFEFYQASSEVVKSICMKVNKQTSIQENIKSMSKHFNIKYRELEKILFKMTGKQYRPVSTLGKGVFGRTYLTCVDDCGDCIAVKIQAYAPNVDTEAKISKIFADHDLALPNIGSSYMVNENGDYLSVIVMPVLDDILGTYLVQKRSQEEVQKIGNTLLKMLFVMCRYGLVHGDLHYNNIGIYKGKLKLIDFGRSVQGPCNKAIELTQLLRTLDIIGIHPDNARILTGMFMGAFVEEYSKIKDSQKPRFDKNNPDFDPVITYLTEEHLNKYNIEES